MNETLSLIEHNPLIYRGLVNDADRANMKRFPYGIWFNAEHEPVVIARTIAGIRC
jgi:toxin ParE1/3/4